MINGVYRGVRISPCGAGGDVPRPPNSAGLLSGNESCFEAGALFGRNEKRLYLQRAAAESTLAQPCDRCAGCKEYPAQTTRFLRGSGGGQHMRQGGLAEVSSCPTPAIFGSFASLQRNSPPERRNQTHRQIIIYYSVSAGFYSNWLFHLRTLCGIILV